MAVNYIQPGKRVKCPVSANGVSGDPEIVGQMPVVLMENSDTNDEADCALEDVFKHPVHGADESGDLALDFGDKIYFDTDELNVDDANGVEYGVALGAVVSGATTEIPVKLKG